MSQIPLEDKQNPVAQKLRDALRTRQQQEAQVQDANARTMLSQSADNPVAQKMRAALQKRQTEQTIKTWAQTPLSETYSPQEDALSLVGPENRDFATGQVKGSYLLANPQDLANVSRPHRIYRTMLLAQKEARYNFRDIDAVLKQYADQEPKDISDPAERIKTHYQAVLSRQQTVNERRKNIGLGMKAKEPAKSELYTEEDRKRLDALREESRAERKYLNQAEGQLFNQEYWNEVARRIMRERGLEEKQRVADIQFTEENNPDVPFNLPVLTPILQGIVSGGRDVGGAMLRASGAEMQANEAGREAMMADAVAAYQDQKQSPSWQFVNRSLRGTFRSATSTIINSTAAALTGLTPGGQATAVAIAGAGIQYNQSYYSAIDRGMSPEEAKDFATADAIAEGLLELASQRIGAGGMSQQIPKMIAANQAKRAVVSGAIAKGLAHYGIANMAEVGPEMLTTLWQQWNAKHFDVDPTAMDDKQLSQAMYDTVVQTIGQSLVMGGLGSAEALLPGTKERAPNAEAMQLEQSAKSQRELGEYIKENLTPDVLEKATKRAEELVGFNPEQQRIEEAVGKQVQEKARDTQDQERIQGGEPQGQEPQQVQPQQEAGRQETPPSGVLQAQEEVAQQVEPAVPESGTKKAPAYPMGREALQEVATRRLGQEKSDTVMSILDAIDKTTQTRTGKSFYDSLAVAEDQSSESMERAAYKRLDEINGLATFLEKSDTSSFLHETWHHVSQIPNVFSAEELSSLNRAIGASVSLLPSQWTARQHERFASMTEEYYRRGVAPTKELRSAFQKVAEYIKAIYQAIKRRVSLPQDVQAVLDNMHGAKKDVSDASQPGAKTTREQSDVATAVQRELSSRPTDPARKAELEAMQPETLFQGPVENPLPKDANELAKLLIRQEKDSYTRAAMRDVYYLGKAQEKTAVQAERSAMIDLARVKEMNRKEAMKTLVTWAKQFPAEIRGKLITQLSKVRSTSDQAFVKFIDDAERYIEDYRFGEARRAFRKLAKLSWAKVQDDDQRQMAHDTIALEKANSSKFTAEDYNQARNVLAGIRHAVITKNLIFLEGRVTSLQEAIDATVEEVEKLHGPLSKGKLGEQGRMGLVKRILLLSMPDAGTATEYIGKAVNEHFYKRMVRGTTQMRETVHSAEDALSDALHKAGFKLSYFGAKKAEKWLTSPVTVLVAGEKLTMRRDERMSLHLMARDPRGHEILRENGFALEKDQTTPRYLMNEGELNAFLAAEEPQEKIVNDALFRWMNTDGRRRINDAAMQTHGYPLATNSNYAHIQVSRRFTAQKGVPSNLGRYAWYRAAENLGILKARVEHSAPLGVSPVIRYFLGHADQVGYDYGLGLPVRNAVMLLQSEQLARQLKLRLGNDGYNILRDHITAVSGAMEKRRADLFDKLINNLSKAILGLRVTSRLKQYGGLALLATEMNAKDVAIGAANYAKHRAKTRADMQKKSADIRSRYQSRASGLFTPIGQEERAGNPLEVRDIGELALSAPIFGIQQGDMDVTGVAWETAIVEAKRMKLKGEEFDRYVSDRTPQAVNDTQNTGDVEHMSAIQRAGMNKPWVRAMMMFRSQSVKAYSILVKGVIRHQRGEITTKQLARNVIMVIGVNALYSAVVGTGYWFAKNAIAGAIAGSDDEEKRKRLLTGLLMRYVTEVTQAVPGADYAVDLAYQIARNGDSIALTPVGDFVNDLVKGAGDTATGLKQLAAGEQYKGSSPSENVRASRQKPGPVKGGWQAISGAVRLVSAFMRAKGLPAGVLSELYDAINYARKDANRKKFKEESKSLGTQGRTRSRRGRN